MHTPGEANCMRYVIVGAKRSGLMLLSTALTRHPKSFCHKYLFHPNENVRKSNYVNYFGAVSSLMEITPCTYWKDDESPYRFLDHRIFGQPEYGEQAIGIMLSYEDIRRYELYLYLKEKTREGSFCVIHLLRNPVACYVSAAQAAYSGVTHLFASEPPRTVKATAMFIDPVEIIDYCREHDATKRRINDHCNDRLEITYEELITDYAYAVAETFKFIGLPPATVPSPATRKIHSHSARSRVLNYADLLKTVPSDVVEHFKTLESSPLAGINLNPVSFHTEDSFNHD